MLNKMKVANILSCGLVFCICLLNWSEIYAQSSVGTEHVQNSEHGTAFAVLLAILLTFVTVYAINLLARYLRETTGNSYSGFDDSDF